MNSLIDDEDYTTDDRTTNDRGLTSYNRPAAYFDRVTSSRTNHANDLTFQNLSTINPSNSTYHNHRMQSIIANRHLSSTVEQYSSVSAQLKSTFTQISRQSISSTSSSSSTTESTSSSLPSSIVEILVKSNENLFKSAENLLKSKDESLMSSDEETVLFKSAENLMKSDELILKSTNASLLSTHENLFRCLSITDESFELNNLNLASSSSSLDSSSFENIYSLYPLDKRPNSINKSKTTQELSFDDSKNDDHKLKKKRRSLNDKKSSTNETANKNHYLVKKTFLKEKNCLNCRINLIELSMKDRKSLTITIKWPLNRKNQKDKKFSLEFRPTTKLNQLINVHIKY